MTRPKITISGTVTNIKYRNETNGYTIAVIETEKLQSITIVGMMNIDEGHSCSFEGSYEFSEKYKSNQFKVESVTQEAIDNKSLVYFLSSSRFRGIGEKTAQKIVNGLGEDALDQIKADPTILSQFKIDDIQQVEIQNELIKHEDFSVVYQILSKIGFGEIIINRIYEYCLNAKIKDVPKMLKENPYELALNIEFVSFKKIDEMFLELGGEIDNNNRIIGFIVQAIKDLCFNSGHTYTDQQALNNRLAESGLNFRFDLNEIYANSDALKSEIVILTNKIFPKKLYDAEVGLGHEVAKRANANDHQLIDAQQFENYIMIVQEKVEIIYSDMQKDAIKKCLEHKISIITGGPGTGKTTIIKGIIEIFFKTGLASSDDIILCAPTGRAAQRMKETTGLNAMTIHSLLE